MPGAEAGQLVLTGKRIRGSARPIASFTEYGPERSRVHHQHHPERPVAPPGTQYQDPLSDSEHHSAGGAERSCAAWSGGRPRRPVAVFRHPAVAAAEPSGNPPSLTCAPARDRSGGSSHPRILWPQGATPARQRNRTRSAHILNASLEHSIVHENSLSGEQIEPHQGCQFSADLSVSQSRCRATCRFLI